jgi:glyoxylase-like metal-dependent hydrolase (beta-lactamase superfamily II)
MKFTLKLSRIFVALTLCLIITACDSIPVYMISEQADSYFVTDETKGNQWKSLGNGLYTYRHWMDRSFIIDTTEGLVVIDSFNEEMASELKSVLNEKFPGKPVSYLIYSHQHLDHTRGGFILEPKAVIAHENTRRHFSYYPDGEVFQPTQYVSGNFSKIFGNHKVDFIDFEHGHAEHLYGFYIESEKLLYALDLAFCEAFPPFGFPDFNHYGHVKALEQAEKLDFDRFISSHFKNGDKSCVTGTLNLFNDTRSAILKAYETYGLPSDKDTAKWFRQVISDTKDSLDSKYGHWHGYDEMVLPFILRQASGAYLGF